MSKKIQKKKLKKSASLFLILALIFGLSGNASSNVGFKTKGHNLVAEVHVMLIENNLCESVKDCRGKKYSFWSGDIKRGFIINIYNIKSKNIINKINNIVVNTYFDNHQEITIKVHFYRKTHGDTDRSIFGIGGDKPFMSMRLNKKIED